MYERYWQFEFNPFENDADPRSFFRGESHQAALLKLRYVIEQRKGAALLTGAGGLGKTYLLQALARQLDESCGPCVQLVFPQMSASELLASLAIELGAAPEELWRERFGLDHVVREIERLLSAHNARERYPVIVVDDAQVIDDLRVFEALRLLLNFQQHQRPRFSLIISGRTELLSTVRRLASLDERLAATCVLKPLSAEETSEYVTSRLAAAGACRPIFNDEAQRSLFELSAGVPRRINRLCDLALLVGFADEAAEISAAQVEAVAQELSFAAAA